MPATSRGSRTHSQRPQAQLQRAWIRAGDRRASKNTEPRSAHWQWRRSRAMSPLLDEAMAGGEVISSLPAGAPMLLTSLCSEIAIQRPIREEHCSAVATALAKQGSTVIDLVLASSLA